MISICVPVYNGSEFIEQCINSILSQTFINFELLISDDCSTDNSLELLQKYQYDNRIRIMCNSKNVGWVKNCNLLISKTKYDYFCIIPCDDHIPINYIEKLYEQIVKDERIVNCYPHIMCFGQIKSKYTQKSILGDTVFLRIEDFILNHLAGVSFRGLIRKTKNEELLYLNEHLKNDIWADSFQILQHAITGKLIEVDVPYYKRFHKNNIHTKWTLTKDDVRQFHLSCYMLLKKIVKGDEINKCINSLNKRLYASQVNNLDDKIKTTFDFIVMGGGIQGCCTALYLKKKGYHVAIIDKNRTLMDGASINHEGKIHLGFVYSNDKTFGTAEKMLIDALNFANSIEYLLDKKVEWDRIKSSKFLYLVPKTSLVRESELDIFFERIQNSYKRMIENNKGLNYLGETPKCLYRKIDIPEHFDKSFFDCCYETEEYSVNQSVINKELVDAIISNNIQIITETNIDSVKRNHGFYEIITNKGIFYSTGVINCLWESKTKIDNCILDAKCYDTNYRYKCGIISKSIDVLREERSITFVNGPFGDFVKFPDYMYFSWYPYSMRSLCCSDKPPDDWNLDKLVGDRQQFLLSHGEMFNYILGKKFDFVEPKIIGGVIVAKGTKDINEMDSKLHERNDTRIKSKGNYYTISTGKYTSAPYNSMMLKNLL